LSAAFPARMASVIVSKKILERSIALFLPARCISQRHDFGGGAPPFTTTEKSGWRIMGDTLSDRAESFIARIDPH